MSDFTFITGDTAGVDGRVAALEARTVAGVAATPGSPDDYQAGAVAAAVASFLPDASPAMVVVNSAVLSTGNTYATLPAALAALAPVAGPKTIAFTNPAGETIPAGTYNLNGATLAGVAVSGSTHTITLADGVVLTNIGTVFARDGLVVVTQATATAPITLATLTHAVVAVDNGVTLRSDGTAPLVSMTAVTNFDLDLGFGCSTSAGAFETFDGDSDTAMNINVNGTGATVDVNSLRGDMAVAASLNATSVPGAVATSQASLTNPVTVDFNGSAGNLPYSPGGNPTGTAGAAFDSTTASIGAANGIAPLDASAKVPVVNLPFSATQFLGNWNATTNTPTLADGTGTAGDTYYVQVGGTRNLGSGSQVFAVGDHCVYDGTIWQETDATDAVLSFNTRSGAVTPQAGDYTATDVGLGNVTNDAQLKAASNLADLASSSTARTNLGLGTAAVAAASSFDPANAASTAQAYAIQRANHTGTQSSTTISNFDAAVRASTLNQMTAPTADLSINTHKLTGVVDPTSAQEAATKHYVDAAVTGGRTPTTGVNAAFVIPIAVAAQSYTANVTLDRTLPDTSYVPHAQILSAPSALTTLGYSISCAVVDASTAAVTVRVMAALASAQTVTMTVHALPRPA